MWSFACIMYELLQYTVRDITLFKKSFNNDRYLFKGGHCKQLSPLNSYEDAQFDEDQISLILKGMGN